MEAGDHEWACYAAQQAAEKGLEALYQAWGAESWGHSVTKLVRGLQDRTDVPEDLVTAGLHLDKLYVPTRYPNGFDEGAPGDYFTRSDSEQAIAHAEKLLRFCERHLP